jgi:hypothetical protein
MEFEENVVLKSTSNIGLPIKLVTPDIKTNSSQTFESNDTRKDLVSDINLTELKIKILKPSGATFDFLKSIEVFISAPNKNETSVAILNPIGDGLYELNMQTTDVNLKDYIAEESFTIRIETVMDEVISQDHELVIYSKYKVKAKLL